MFEKPNYIELSGVKYPYKCDMFVLERFQDKYGDLSEVENKLRGFTPKRDETGEIEKDENGNIWGVYGEPNMTVLMDALAWMVEEGIDIERETGKEIEPVERKTLIRSVDVAPRELGNALHEEFKRCFARKNGKTTQTTSKTAKRTKE